MPHLSGTAHPAYKHGQSGNTLTPEYSIWAAMLQRCRNPESANYTNYGGRGIKVCPRWETFENFYADMGPRPSGRSIERRDNDGDYTPENCRWATRTEQSRNTRTATMVTIGGTTKPLAEWCELHGVNRSTALKRINRSGWPPELAVTTPQLWSRP